MQTYSYALNFDPVLILHTDFAGKYPILCSCWNGSFDSAHTVRQNQRQFQKCLAWGTLQCHQLFALAIPFNSPVRQLGPLLSLEFGLVSPDTQFSLLCAHSCTSKMLRGICLVSYIVKIGTVFVPAALGGAVQLCAFHPLLLCFLQASAKADVSLCSRAAGWHSAQGEATKLLSFCFD